MSALLRTLADLFEYLFDLGMALNARLNVLIWGPVMLIILIGVGVYVTLRTRFIQFSKFGLMCQETLSNFFKGASKAEGDVTPFQALTVAMGGTVGVGNISDPGS